MRSGLMALTAFAACCSSACAGSDETGGSTSCCEQHTEAATVAYTTDADTVFPNPERGFYRHYGTRPASYQALDATTLEGHRTDDAVTLILRLWYLTGFEQSAISADYLTLIQTDFDALRQAGLKAIVRFAYTSEGVEQAPDAAKAQVLAHIAQLEPLLQANGDVIALVQAGFVGAWGEWYYSANFGTGGATDLSTDQLSSRREVLDALLDALPSSRTVALRTPAFKQAYYGTAALTSSEAFGGSDAARVGHHDDCFLANETDYGTYLDVTADKAYLAQEDLYVPQGGETCATSDYSVWSNAATDMEALHFSYLNADYNLDVLSSWGSSIDDARRKLGYRFALVQGTYGTAASTNGSLSIAFTIRNDGWAAPYNPRTARIVLRETSSGAVYSFALQADPRSWTPGATTSVEEEVTLSDVPEGTYDLLLHLPDPEAALSTRPEYAVRFANTGVWEASTGYNQLGSQVLVSEP